MTYHFVTETVTKLLEIRHRVAAVKDPKVEYGTRTRVRFSPFRSSSQSNKDIADKNYPENTAERSVGGDNVWGRTTKYCWTWSNVKMQKKDFGNVTEKPGQQERTVPAIKTGKKRRISHVGINQRGKSH